MFSGYLLKQSIQAFYTPNKIIFEGMTVKLVQFYWKRKSDFENAR